MNKTISDLNAIKLIGIKARTCNLDEVDWQHGVIFPCIQRYFHQAIAQQIPNRITPGTTYCVYTDYESDHTGEYTYFIGEAVDSFEGMPENLEKHTIPAQTYVKFATQPGAMPNVVREPWQKIWTMSDDELGGKRAYKADFEIYDERAADHEKVVLDIFIGVEA